MAPATEMRTFACRLHGQVEEIYWSIVQQEDSPQAQFESIRGHSQTDCHSNIWERMMGDEGE